MADLRTVAVPFGGYGRHLITLSASQAIDFPKVSSSLIIKILIPHAQIRSIVFHGVKFAFCICYHHHQNLNIVFLPSHISIPSIQSHLRGHRVRYDSMGSFRQHRNLS